MSRDKQFKKLEDYDDCECISTPRGLDGINGAIKRSAIRWRQLNVVRRRAEKR